MYNTRYFKAVCSHCEGHIEFPETAVGQLVDCPHCGQKTQLRVAKLAPRTEPEEDEQGQEETEEEVEKPETPASTPQPPPPQRRKGPNLVLILSIACPVVLLVVLGLFFHRLHQTKSTAAPPPAKTAAVHTNQPVAVTNAPVNTNPPAPPRPKSLSDLKVGAIQFEKTKGSSLVYAVGTIENDSVYQHFGVRIVLNLYDQRGDKVGTATDYQNVIEPHKSWHFRALITDFKAVSAKLDSITEAE